MSHADFVHLRVHSAYSLSEGAIKLKKLAELCKKQGMPAVAVTDSGNMFGALEFADAASAVGVQPIIGTQLGLSRPVPRGGQRPLPEPIVLLAQNQTGYRNLMKLVSQAWVETGPGEPPQVAMDVLALHTDGVICLTGGAHGPVGKRLLEGQTDMASETLAELALAFPGRCYVELQRHDLEDERRTEAGLVDLAYAQNLPLVATNECFFADDSMYEAHDALLCIAEGRYVIEEDRRRVTPDHRFKSAAEMRALFADLPEAVDNTLVIARRCSFLLKPIKPLLPAFDAVDEAQALRDLASNGLKARLIAAKIEGDAQKPYWDRLDFELNVIAGMKFPGYFLIVADFIQWTKSQNIPVGPGRGSGAGSVVAWALTITDLDPLRFGLLFERFLNPERVSMPDFDIDFCQDRRDEVIQYVRQRYGEDRVAQIITFGKLQARAVLRDVGRVLQMPFGQVDRLTKLVPNNPANPVTLEQAIAGEPMLQAMRDSDESVAKLIDLALKLEGLYRHASTHAAGVVIGDRPLNELVPLYKDPKSDMLVTQFNMKWVEQAGLVKFDFLGLTTLTVLEKAVELIERGGGPRLDLTNLPLDDAKTYHLLARAETTGVFQLESSGMRDVLRRMKPDRFEDIIALVALYRPGPMDNIPRYIAVKNGEEKPDYLHPKLEPILAETFGIMIYQEQVMQIAQVLSGYSLGDADLLRRAMGKKIQAEMDAQRQRFIEGAKTTSGVDAQQASEIFDLVDKFAGYGFNKSHAAAYALVAYQTAYVKANFPVEFLAASMTYSMANTDKLGVYRQELDRMGLKLLPPDVNRSLPDFGVEEHEGAKAVRYALAAIKGVGIPAMRSLVEARAEQQFKDPFDVVRRVDPKALSKRQLESLIYAGAFDTLERNRHRLFEAADTLLRFGQSVAAERDSGQVSLFGGAGPALAAPPLPSVADWDQMERLRHEFEAIGFCLSAHPLDSFQKALTRLGVVKWSELPARIARGGATRYRMAGVVVGKQERTSAKGNRFAFVQLSDTTGVFEAVMFSEVLSAHRDKLVVGTPLVVFCDAQMQGEEARLTVQSVEELEQAAASAAGGLEVFLRGPEPVDGLQKLLGTIAKGRGQIFVVVPIEGQREVRLQLPGAFAFTAKDRGAIKSMPGIIDVHDL
ncbi:DNA polymerase III subunit alpha [Roseiterribacter gracilis]|uniref:DNA polymerase III subunit alpha n=1 Tax=Roseiterribacter gracilis TaxID=2812848 RepID=A0A8S8X698_9PROT|nr:DNA-directed DNA polymerase [Rhodospirillales bacterium TMPK1]